MTPAPPIGPSVKFMPSHSLIGCEPSHLSAASLHRNYGKSGLCSVTEASADGARWLFIARRKGGEEDGGEEDWRRRGGKEEGEE